MLFNSYEFLLVFLPLALLVWWLVRPSALRLWLLTGLSCVFYGWWDPRFVPLMLVTASADYVAGQGILRATRAAERRAWLIAALVLNLGLLAVFKYWDFASRTVAAMFDRPGMLPLLHLTLPVGISFYTFNSISYSVDVYRGRTRPAGTWSRFAAFVTMFPHLVAGPIVRYADMGPQLERLPPRLEADRAWRGLCFFALGLAKKVLLADLIAGRIVDPLFGTPATLGAAAAWLAALAYTLQLYFDFSGYSDMAVGLAHLLGLDFPQNFNSPYKAANIAEFWQRWHMSLSTWLRDYLFIPLGGSRGSRLATARNLGITMLLGGLWHGAAWTFVIWGSYHGALLGGRAWLRAQWPSHAPRRLGVPLTFLAVLLGWVIFRAPTAGAALLMYRAMLGLAPGADMGAGLGGITAVGVGLVVVGGAIVFLRPNTWELTYRPTTPTALGLGLLLFICILRLGNPSPFLYFQF